MLNKVPEVTVGFWAVKVLSTTVGETGADFLSATLKLGLTITTIVMAALLAIALVAQFRARRYVPSTYWIAVVLISVVGTLFTDTLVDVLGVPLVVTTAVFAAALLATFVWWFVSERTLSIHSIITSQREGFYWLTILFTFALGTAAGDLLSEKLNFGYTVAALAFGGMIAVIAAAHYGFKLHAIPAFWLAYIFTRPLGASLGDLLSQNRADGGWGVGTTITSIVFLAIIVWLVARFTRAERAQSARAALAS